ncbi:UbiX family flavin prenyltransferase [Picrophilus oshimae]|uniref:Flavin prenyltransferase UbiX n=1 Tax=Picrophilus torridus (strain ATCC 700027 / DSM 9790 / JCM 10055 / NBRC 100828 / KAW 2/3) TaxID=1122961 RepID=A0A8G2FY52_PICTO|nr:UbiX family flavin prenyltransferase [Picrophilus oshimae]SMD31691.1 4-hydroxy-3-polyprenylbenzoate decarboxylase [Picrophilus oshimae DSM 9789]
MRVVIGITGASGTILAVRLLENLKDVEKHLVMSESAKRVMELETDYKYDYIKGLADYVYNDDDIAANISSGSFRYDALVIIPCSSSTMAKIASGISDTLITRTALVAMKERRRFIIVPREMPLSTIMIENMLKLSRYNVIIAPAMPGYYNRPRTVDDMVNFVVARVLDLIGIENDVSKRWEH